MAATEEQVKDALKAVKYPGFTRDIVSFGLVKSINIDNGDVRVQLQEGRARLTGSAPSEPEPARDPEPEGEPPPPTPLPQPPSDPDLEPAAGAELRKQR